MKNNDASSRSRVLVLILCLFAGLTVISEAGQTSELDALKTKYVQAKGKIDRDVFCVYSNNVAALVSQFKKKGDFDTCLLLVKEQKALLSLPIVPTGEARETLVKGVSGYGEMMQKLDAEKVQRLLKLQKLYVARLEGLLKELMAADKMEEARQANEEKEKVVQLIAACKPPAMEVSRVSTVEAEPPAVPKDENAATADAAKTSKTIAKHLVIIKATLNTRGERSRDVTEAVRDAVEDDRLNYRDWDEHYGGYWRHESVLNVQYRFGNGLMKSIQARNGNAVVIGDAENR